MRTRELIAELRERSEDTANEYSSITGGYMNDAADRLEAILRAWEAMDAHYFEPAPDCLVRDLKALDTAITGDDQ